VPQVSGWPARERLAEAGHRVLTLDIDAEAIARFQNEFGEGSAVVCDVADAAQVEAAFHSLVEPHQRVDLLLNNAGIAGPQQPVEDIEVAAWQSTIDTDLNSVFLSHASGDPADEVPAQRSDSQYVLQCRALRLPNALPLRGSQMGGDWARPDLGDGAGPLEYQGQCAVPGQCGRGAD
jgi:hypothetical protein